MSSLSFSEWLEEVDPGLAAVMGTKPKSEEPSPYMSVSMSKQDVDTSKDFEQGFSNMLKVVARLLSDPDQTVKAIDPDSDQVAGEVPWSQLYQLDVLKSSPQHGTITLRYKPTWGKGSLGKGLWSAAWFLKNPLKKGAKWLGQQAGILTDPESFYLNQFKADLLAYAAQELIKGVDSWDITTSTVGRDILLTPKS